MGRKFNSIAYLITVFIQVTLILLVIVINDLTRKNAGVMRHVYHRRGQYEQGIYSSNSLLWQSILATVIGVILIVLLIYAIRKRQGMFYRVQIGLTSFLCFTITFVINSAFFINMLAYPYCIMVFQLVLFIQGLIFIVLKSGQKLLG